MTQPEALTKNEPLKWSDAMPQAVRTELSAIESLRTLYRQEMNGQIIHDSIHVRPGWTIEYLLIAGGIPCGYGSVAVAGPWKDKPTFYEFYLLPEQRRRAFAFFEAFLAESGARFLEVQSNDELSTVMALTYGRDFATESILFRDQFQSALPSNGATLRPVTAESEIREAMERRQGGGEWLLEFDGAEAGKGGVLFHYNPPYGDIYMEVVEPFRRRGLGAWLVQELKRECYRLGAMPGARCNPANIASRRTLQRAGFVPVGHLLNGALPEAR